MTEIEIGFDEMYSAVSQGDLSHHERYLVERVVEQIQQKFAVRRRADGDWPQIGALLTRVDELERALDAECEQKYKHVAEIMDLKGALALTRAHEAKWEAGKNGWDASDFNDPTREDI